MYISGGRPPENSTEKKKKKIFFSKFQNGPIRKVNMLKSKFDDIFVPAPLLRSLARHLENFSTEKKIEKSQDQNCLDLVSIPF